MENFMKYYLAPMEGVTTYVFRRAYHNTFRPMDKYFTPFIVPHTQKKMAEKEWAELNPEHNAGMYVVPQILTNNAEDFVCTARMLYSYGYREVNLNLGCPSKTVVTKGRGSGFLEDPGKLDRFFGTVFDALDVTKEEVSIKTRIGLDSPLEFEDLLKVYEKYPLEELIIHPRLQCDYYKNIPNWDVFAQAVESSKHTLCYNGDIFLKEDYQKFITRFPQIDRIMLGRGIVAYPDLLDTLDVVNKTEVVQDSSDRHELMSTSLAVGTASFVLQEDEKKYMAHDYKKLRKFHDEILAGYAPVMSGEKNLLYRMKEFWSYFQHNFPDSPKLWKKIKKCEKMAVYHSIVDEIFAGR